MRTQLDNYIEALWLPQIPLRCKLGKDPFDWATQKAAKSWLYVLCRALRPKTVIETGIDIGVSSTLILMALHRNNAGELYSVDIRRTLDEPSYPARGSFPVGFIVPRYLQSRWHVLIGDSKELLPRLCADLGHVGLFLHDSDHSYDHMLFELRTVWPHLALRGVLAADDINLNSAFDDFAREKGIGAVKLGGCGFVASSSSE